MTEKPIHEENSRTALTEYAAESNKSKKLPQIQAALLGKIVCSPRPQVLAALGVVADLSSASVINLHSACCKLALSGLATLGAFSAGTCISWSSPALPLYLHNKTLSDTTLTVTTDQSSWIGALITLGAFCGAIPAGVLANKLGRKRLLQLLALPMFASWITIAYCNSLHGLYFARYLAGIAVGAYSVAIPMYVAELAESRIRGTLGTLFQLQITAGILFEYIIGVTENLQMMALVPAVIPILFLLGFSFMPESPVYLSNRNRIIDAKISLQWFRGASYDVEDEITRIQEQIRDEQENKASLMDLVRNRAAFKAMIIALGLMTFQQLSGINAVIFYTQSIFKDSGSIIPSYATPIIVGTVMVVATYLSTIFIDRAGRRILLLISSCVMAICLSVLAFYFYLSDQNVKLPFAIPLLSITIYITVFSLGFGPIPWMMLGELFSPKLKGAASSISAAFNWLLAFTVTKLFVNMLVAFGSGTTFACFAFVCILGTMFVFFLVPETKGKDLEEIQQMLGGYEKGTQIQDDDDENSDVVVIDIKNNI